MQVLSKSHLHHKLLSDMYWQLLNKFFMLLRLNFHLQLPDKLIIIIYFYSYIFFNLLKSHEFIECDYVFFVSLPRLQVK